MTNEDLKKLLAAQQGELDAVLLYQVLSKKAKSQTVKDVFLEISADEGKHAGILKTYTETILKPKKGKAIVVGFLYSILGHDKVCELLAKGERAAIKDYEALSDEYPKIKEIMADELRHAEMTKSLRKSRP